MGITDKVYGWATKSVLNKAKATIEKAIKDDRLIFLKDGNIQYTDREGDRAEYTVEKMAETFLDITGQRDNMEKVGLGEKDIQDILLEEYKKVKK